MKKYSIDELLKHLGYSWLEIEEMGESEINLTVVENDYRECSRCGYYVHTDDFNGEQELCDECI